ncbi:MAG: hypothetical protein IT249_14900 [Chitinophagaceae bacterium]|nr:hypothetical protein [Chitinophagaceae bacterium]
MTQTMQLQQIGLTPISEFEMEEIKGGGGGGSFWIWVGKEIINNWDEFTKGVKDGWNSVHYNK